VRTRRSEPKLICSCQAEDEQFQAMKPLLDQSLGNPRILPLGQQPFSLRTFIYAPEGDGIVFLRDSSLSRAQLVKQWEQLRDLICQRPLLPRLIIAASGFAGDLCAERRHDLVAVLRSAREPWCHWVAVADLQRLCEVGQRQLIDLFAIFGVQVYLEVEPMANPLPARCERCHSPRADVVTIGHASVCTSCRGSVDSRQLIAELFELYVRDGGSGPEDAF
jgi:hypothetical protein